jgi:hypothetical protein
MQKLFSAIIDRIIPLRSAVACDPFAHCDFPDTSCGYPHIKGCCPWGCVCC